MDFIISAKYQKKKNELALEFKERVASTGGTIRILNKNNKVIQKIKVGSNKTKGGIYFLETYVFDYPYDWIALDSAEIFGALAKHDKQEIKDKTAEAWALDLRTVWNISMDGKFYQFNKSTTNNPSTDEYYNYHSTTPEYTPGYDESGFKDIVLTPLGGIKSLKIKLNKKKIKPGDYKIDISEAGLRPAKGEDLNLNEKISDTEEFKVADKTSNKNNKSNKNKELKTKGDDLFTSVDNFLTAIKQRKLADFATDDELTGTYNVKYINEKQGGKFVKHKTRISFDTTDWPILSGLGVNSVTHYTFKKKTKKDITPFGNAVKEGSSFHYYAGQDKVAELTLLGTLLGPESHLKKRVKQFKNSNYSGTFNLSLEDNQIDFYKGSKEPWMSATFVDDLF